MAQIKRVNTFVQDNTKILKLISIVFLVCIPWMKISQAKLSGSFKTVTFLNLFIVVLWGLALHVLILVINYLGARLIQVSVPVRKAIVILASTKTLAITLSVITFLPSNVGNAGVMSLPITLMHVVILIFDSLWVVHWNSSETVNNDSNDLLTTSETEHSSYSVVYVSSL